MKNFKKNLAWSLLGLAIVITSCEKEETVSNETPNQNTNEVSQDILNNLKDLSFNTDNIKIVNFKLPNGSVEKRYQVEGDILLTEDYINSMQLNGGVQSEQYRTSNLVRPRNRTLRVLGFTGGQFALSQKGREGLRQAVNNYNNVNNIEIDDPNDPQNEDTFGLRLSLSFGSFEAIDDADMVIYDNPSGGGAGGSAGFPSFGNPNKFIQIFGLDDFSVGVNTEVIAHEIGHSIGLRHTDWFSRESCTGFGSTGSESQAIYIPGTPRGFDPNSIMLSCGSGPSDGNFGRFDIVALKFLY